MNTMINYEMQGLTWQARKKTQQDAILIAGKVIQHKGIYSKPYCFNGHDSWCVAVADGVSSHRHSDQAAKQVLHIVQHHYAEYEHDVSLLDIQQQLCEALIPFDLDQEDEMKVQAIQGASTTMALLRHCQQDQPNTVRIQHLGDSRVYIFRQHTQQWQALTEDDNFYNESIKPLSDEKRKELYIDEPKEQLASMYYVLTQFFCVDWLHEVPNRKARIEQVQHGDAFLVCTDGVFDALAPEQWQVIQTDQSLKQWLQIFLESLKPTAGDNVSLVLVRATEG